MSALRSPLGGKADLVSRFERDQNERPGGSATERGDEKLETATAPNPRPLWWI